MRRVIAIAALALVAVACGPKPAPPPPEDEDTTTIICPDGVFNCPRTPESPPWTPTN